MEEISSLSERDLRKYGKMPLDFVVSAFDGIPSPTAEAIIRHRTQDFGENPNAKLILKLFKTVKSFEEMPSAEIEKTIRRRERALGKNPAVLITLFKSGEKFPEVKTALEKTQVAETRKLNLAKTWKLLADEKSDSVRELKNHVAHAVRSKIKSHQKDIYYLNPNTHKNDPIDTLTTFLINNPESAFSFLRDKTIQQELSANPLLIAKMIVGDVNLRKTIEKEGTFELPGLPPETSEALKLLAETKTILDDNQFKKNKSHSALNERLQSLISSDKQELSLPALLQLNKDIKTTVIASIQSTLDNPPLKGSQTAVALQEKLDILKNAQSELENPSSPMEAKASTTLQKQVGALNEDSYGLKLDSEVENAAEKLKMLSHIQSALKNPLLDNSPGFSALRSPLTLLNENSPTEDILQLHHQVNEIEKKVTALAEIKSLLTTPPLENHNASKTLQEKLGLLNEDSSDNDIDKLSTTVKDTRAKLNLLAETTAFLNQPHLKGNENIEALKERLHLLDENAPKNDITKLHAEVKKTTRILTEAHATKTTLLEKSDAEDKKENAQSKRASKSPLKKKAWPSTAPPPPPSLATDTLKTGENTQVSDSEKKAAKISPVVPRRLSGGKFGAH